jgi:hypothetical protein
MLAVGYEPRTLPCANPGATRMCWTGPLGRRHTGRCHDGVQRCGSEGEEFATGSCEGQEHDCGEAPDAGQPGECGCILASVISCDDDCSVNIFCSQTAEKTCLPDATWGVCRETGRLPTLFQPTPLPDGGIPTALS